METYRYQAVTILIDKSEEQLINWIRANQFSRYILLTDKNCYKKVWPSIKKQFSFLRPIEIITIAPGEKSKNLTTAEKIWTKLSRLKADRQTLFINLGGGVVCDLGAFVASVYKRGIAYINIPTTLLAMTDAAIGSKTALDLNDEKNILGTFYHPKQVWVNSNLLKTLPFDEWMNGMAEVFKHGMCDSQTHLDIVIQELEHLNSELIIRQSVAFKCEVVNEDLYDLGKRKVLNLGHTTGHAIESFLLSKGQTTKHGICVFYGLVTALLLSVKYYDFPSEKSTALIRHLKRYCPILPLRSNDIKKILKLMHQDKKNNEGEIRMVLLKDIGIPVLDVAVKEKEIVEAIRATIEIISV